MEFAGGLLEQGLVDPLDVASGRLQQAGRRQVVNRARKPAGEVMDQLLDRVVKHVFRTTRLLHLDVDVAPGLLL